MSSSSTPWGFRPAFHPSGFDRAKAYTIASGYATALYKGAPVRLDPTTNLGTIIAATAGTNDLLGVLAGVSYVDATGRPVVSNYWPASTVATSIVAWVWDDPANIYEVQLDGTGTFTAAAQQTWIGGQMDCVNPTSGNTITGISTAALAGSTFSASLQKQFRITGFGGQLDNALGDQYLIVQCQIAQHQFVANKVAV